ncbi:MAG: AAA family ATPase [Phycisphaeraceae bacterium]
MYHEFYKLAMLPFENTPDPRFFYASEQHREALAAIEYTIRMRKGFVLVTGDIGSGKTTVGRTMLERCGQRALILTLLHGHDSGLSLLRQTLRSLELPLRKSDDHARMLEYLRAKLIEQIEQGRPVVLFVDEAQTLPDEALEELRLMSNFDTTSEKLIQVVLIGQPELRARMRTTRLAALRQRIVLAKQLHPLAITETQGYITHRLRAASLDPQDVQVNFDAGASSLIHEFAGGVPRLINVACDNCLLLGFVREARQITAALVQRGLEDMAPSFADTPWSPAASTTTTQSTMRLAGSM